MAKNSLHGMIQEPFYSALTDVASAWIHGTRLIRRIIVAAMLTGFCAFVLWALVGHRIINQSLSVISYILGVFSASLLVGIIIYRSAITSEAVTAQIAAVEQRARDNPNEPTAAWDLARLKLESYLDRNLFGNPP